jgi:TctA family transporter
MILVVDALVVKKLLNIGPRYYESRQEYLYKWNPVGVWPLIISCVLGTIAALGFMGTFLQSTASIFAAILAGILTIIFAVSTKGKYYIKQETNDIPKEDYI